MESRCNRRVHVDEHVLLCCDGLVPLFNLFANPDSERLSNDCRSDIYDPLLGRLPQLLIVGQELDDFLVLEKFIEDFGKLQVLVSGHMRMDNTVHRHELLLAFDKIFHEVDGKRVYRWQVRLDVDGEECEQFYEEDDYAARVLTSLAPEL